MRSTPETAHRQQNISKFDNRQSEMLTRRYICLVVREQRELFIGLIRIHVLVHVAHEPIYGLAMMDELKHHGYPKLPRGMEKWKAKTASHFSTPPTTATSHIIYPPRYTNNRTGTKHRAGHMLLGRSAESGQRPELSQLASPCAHMNPLAKRKIEPN